MPFASNELYPFAARSLSLRASLRKSLRLGAGLTLHGSASRIWNLDAAGELLDAAAFRLLPAEAYFVNVGRSNVVDDAALIEALESGRLAGAAPARRTCHQRRAAARSSRSARWIFSVGSPGASQARPTPSLMVVTQCSSTWLMSSLLRVKW